MSITIKRALAFWFVLGEGVAKFLGVYMTEFVDPD